MVRKKNKTKLLRKKSKSLGKRSARAITPEEVNKLITLILYNNASGNRGQSSRSLRVEAFEASQSRARHSEVDNQSRDCKASMKGPNEKSKIEDLSSPLKGRKT